MNNKTIPFCLNCGDFKSHSNVLVSRNVSNDSTFVFYQPFHLCPDCGAELVPIIKNGVKEKIPNTFTACIWPWDEWGEATSSLDNQTKGEK